MSSSILHVGTESGLWTLGAGGPRRELEGRRVDWLAERDGALSALVDRREIWHRADSGWELGATSPDLELRCLMPLEDDVLVGSEGAHLLRTRKGRLEPVEGFERAEGREEWFTPWGGPPDVRSMARDADGDFYVNVHVGGILRSVDGGESFTATIDLESDVHEVLAVPGAPGRLIAATAYGLAETTDGGESWEVDARGLEASYCRAVALAGEAILLSASEGPRGRRSALYRRPLAGAGFERCEGGLPGSFPDNIDTGCVAAASGRAAFGTRDGRLFVSDDAGVGWRLTHEELPPVLRVVMGAV